MGSKKDVSEAIKAKICTLLQFSGLPKADIAKICCVGKTTVYDIVKKMELFLSLESSRIGRSGRNRCTTAREDRIIKKIAEANKKLPLEGLKKSIEEMGVDISNRTLRRKLSEIGLNARRPCKKQLSR